jgi:hypothetical protein
MSNPLLVDVSERLLETVVDALDAPPDRQFITDGDPMTMYAFCPFVAVAMAPSGLFQSINVAARGRSLPARPTARTSASQMILKAWVITDDCWPTQLDDGGVPDPDLITSHASAVLTDRYDVWVALRDECNDSTLFQGLVAGKDHAAVDPPATAFGPQGQVAGSIFSVYLDLMGVAPGS